MALTEDEIIEFREALKNAERPFFMFDDDPDGLSSFLLLYRMVQEGKGMIMKSAPVVKEEYVAKVKEYGPDLVVILDMPDVEQAFLDAMDCKVLWLDHHQPQDKKGVRYFNPRVHDDSNGKPTSYWCWQIVKDESPEDFWIAMVGCVSDWFLPEFAGEFSEKYPGLLDKDVPRVQEALFDSPLGKVCRVFSFLLKGKTSDAMKSVKILTRITEPKEILEQTSAQGAFVWKRYLSLGKEYDALITSAKKCADDDLFLVFQYTETQTSFTSDLSNELLYRFPEKIIFVCRNKSGKMKCSSRSSEHELPSRIEEAMNGLDGYGGGHAHACGIVVREDQFNEFLSRFKESFK
jgi:single-stranded DNA-specific DHH superfamily exonuclease